MQNYKIINKNNLINNVNICQKYCKNICVMLKAEGYGHGINNILNLLKNNIKYFGVANKEEALKVRKFCKTCKIIVVGKTNSYVELIKNISITIDCLDELITILNVCKKLNMPANVHVAVNTGMNRIGVKTLLEFKDILKFIDENNFIILEGVFTHCFDADKLQSNFYNQMHKFYCFVKELKDKKILIHIGGSFVLKHKIPNFVNMVRIGFFIYGYGMAKLKPVMSIQSKIIKIINAKKGEYIGYGTHKLKSDAIIATIPIGYADGLTRQASNKYFVEIKHQKCPIIGSICMDMCMVDISKIACKVGDRVNVFNNALCLAKCIKTSPYEILTNFQKLRGKCLIV